MLQLVAIQAVDWPGVATIVQGMIVQVTVVQAEFSPRRPLSKV